MRYGFGLGFTAAPFKAAISLYRLLARTGETIIARSGENILWR